MTTTTHPKLFSPSETKTILEIIDLIISGHEAIDILSDLSPEEKSEIWSLLSTDQKKTLSLIGKGKLKPTPEPIPEAPNDYIREKEIDGKTYKIGDCYKVSLENVNQKSAERFEKNPSYAQLIGKKAIIVAIWQNTHGWVVTCSFPEIGICADIYPRYLAV